MNKNLIITFIFTVLLASCSSKRATHSNECGEGTTLQGIGIGSIAGGVVAKISQVNPITGILVGGVVGAVAGKKLASMQCKYYGKEKKLLEKIESNILEQDDLAKQSRELNRKMSKLYKDITLLKNTYSQDLAQKEKLLRKIAIKKEEVQKIQKLNSSVMKKTKEYYKELNQANYSKKDRKSIEQSLQSILSSLDSIEKSSRYNLEQLNQFKQRILS